MSRTTASNAGADHLLSVESGLKRVRAAAWRRLVFQALLGIAAWTIGIVALLAGLDYLLRLPQGLRAILWVIGAGVFVLGVRRLLLPAVRFKPSLTEIALRVERSRGAEAGGLRGVLASGLELGAPAGDGPQETSAMAGRVVTDAASRFGAVRLDDVFAVPASVRRDMSLLLLSLAPALAVVLLAPQLASIGAKRILTPWSDQAWPKRTGLVDSTGLTAHATGTALPLRAVLTKTNRPEGRTDVWVNSRVAVDGVAGPLQRSLLTFQNRSAGANAPQGELYERLLEPDAFAASSARASGDASRRVTLEYWFESDDDSTRSAIIELVDPPTVAGVTVEVQLPEYARDAAEPSDTEQAGALVSGSRLIAVGPGQPVTVGPLLAGSRVELGVKLSKPLPAPGVEDAPRPREGETPDRAAWLALVFANTALPDDFKAALTRTEWTFSWTAGDSVRLPMKLVDEHGIAAVEDTVFVFEGVADRTPTVSIVEPAQDESVLATAILDAATDARDDVGLTKVGLATQLLRPPPDSPGALPEPVGDEAAVAEVTSGQNARGPWRASAQLDLSTMNVRAGDELWLTGIAADGFRLGDRTHGLTRSTPRKLRIISETDFAKQVLDELTALRQAAVRLDQEQARINERTGELAAGPERGARADRLRSEQADLRERMAPPSDLLQRLNQRVDRNNLADRSLRGMLQDAKGLMDAAAQSAGRSAEQLNNESRRPEAERPSGEERDALDQSQREIRDNLGRLVDMLDRGQDGWAVRQSVERLLAEQKQAAQATQEAGRATAGKPASELTAQEQAELDRQARAQEDLARRADSAIEQLERTAQRLERTDPTQAEAMREAARQARQDQLSQNQRDAAQQTRQNRTAEAGQRQQQAQNTLSRMLNQLDEAQRKRDETLRRVLADLAQQIEALIARQQVELERLGKAIDGEQVTGLDASMIELHTNTRGVAESTRAREAAPVIVLVEAAGRSQEAAIVNLRSEPPDAVEAEGSERQSLARLEEALALARKLDQQAEQRDNDRKREELREAYEQILDRQKSIRDDAAPMIGQEIDRRQRASLRGLGEKQGAIKEELSALRSKTEEMGEAGMFDYAHRRLDTATGDAATKLNAGEAPKGLARSHAVAIETLEALVDALKDEQKKRDEFRSGESAGSSSGGQNGQGQPQPMLPPIAELKMLRRMQIDAAKRTREAADAGLADEELTGLAEDQSALAEQGAVLLEKLKQQAEEREGDGTPN
jgi:hypothetical protein